MPDLSLLRKLPSVDEVLARPSVRALAERLGRTAAKAAAQAAIASARKRILEERGTASRAGGGKAPAGTAPTPDPGELVPDPGDLVSDAAVEAAAAALLAPRLRAVINATGVVLHTNLGRAPLHREVVARVAEVAAGYCNLELDLDSGRRGARHAAVEPLLCELFGAAAAHAVGNCAGATMLALAAHGAGGAAVVSRGELVEIGGGFRVPDILAQSGCRLVEVGTTNRTHLRDYEAALDRLGVEKAAPLLVLRVHRSNFALVGFHKEPALAELVALAHKKGALFVHDLGSGAMARPPAAGLPQEETARRSLEAGADLVLISGDKLLGGPQAGLLLGTASAVEKCRAHPLARALRPDKLILAALEGTLSLYRQGRGHELPALAALSMTGEALRQRATRLALLLGERGVSCSVVECEGRVGGGSMPTAILPSCGVSLGDVDGEAVLAALRRQTPAVVGILRDGAVTLDVRCVPDAQLVSLGEAAAAALQEAAGRQPAGQGPADAGDAFGPESATLTE